MRKDVDMESSPLKSMYMEQNGEQFEEVKGEGSFGLRKNSRTSPKKQASDAKPLSPKRVVEARMTQLRKDLTTPEQVDFRGRRLNRQSSSPDRKGGRKSVSKSNAKRK